MRFQKKCCYFFCSDEDKDDLVRVIMRTARTGRAITETDVSLYLR